MKVISLKSQFNFNYVILNSHQIKNTMNKKIKNLFNQEEWIILNISNCAHQVNVYLNQLKKLKQAKPDKIDEQEFIRFKRIFKYYKKHLIPTIQEFALLEQKHLNLVSKNPDPEFTPILDEFSFHKTLMIKFTKRFEEIHKEFHQFYTKTNSL